MGIFVTAKHKRHLNNICSSLLLLQINSQHAIQRKILFEKKKIRNWKKNNLQLTYLLLSSNSTKFVQNAWSFSKLMIKLTYKIKTLLPNIFMLYTWNSVTRTGVQGTCMFIHIHDCMNSVFTVHILLSIKSITFCWNNKLRETITHELS